MSGTLRSVQSLFQQHMLGRADAQGLLAGSPHHRVLGLSIYANAYRSRLLEALADAYTKTHAWLGDALFDRVALDYIERQAPNARNLRWYGADFAEQLPPTVPRRAAVAELMRLEWALRGVFDGADSAVLGNACLGAIPAQAWATLHLQAVPTAQMLCFDFNTVAVWQALDDGLPAPPCAHGLQPVHWLLWRKDLQPHFRSLDALQHALIGAVLEGASFAAACERAQVHDPTQAAERIGACLRQSLDDGLIRGWHAGQGVPR